MQLEKLAAILKSRYHCAPIGGSDRSASILSERNFRIALLACRLKTFCVQAGISPAFAPELSKAYNLTPFVQLQS